MINPHGISKEWYPHILLSVYATLDISFKLKRVETRIIKIDDNSPRKCLTIILFVLKVMAMPVLSFSIYQLAFVIPIGFASFCFFFLFFLVSLGSRIPSGRVLYYMAHTLTRHIVRRSMDLRGSH